MSEAELWDWRQKVANLYFEIRHLEDPEAAWRMWCNTRGKLFRSHPQSPIEPDAKDDYQGPATFPYDPSLRLAVELTTPPGERFSIATGDDGEITLNAFARTKGSTTN